MFQAALAGARAATEALRASLDFNQALRKALAGGGSLVAGGLPRHPPLDEWRRLDYSITVGRLYQIYESLIHDCVREWLDELCKLVPYTELPAAVRDTHRNGLGWILQNFEGRRFDGLSLQNAVRDYEIALAGKGAYTLLADAFLLHDRNLRIKELQEVLRGCGLQTDLADWFRSHRISKHDSLQQLGHSSVEKCLAAFIDLRNEASHATRKVSEVLGEDSLLAYVDFVASFCECAVEAITCASMAWHTEHGRWLYAGKVGEVIGPDKRICVAPLDNCTIAVGSVVFLGGTNYFTMSTIEEIQIDSVRVERFTVAAQAREVGLRLSTRVSKNAKVYIESTPAPSQDAIPKPEGQSIDIGVDESAPDQAGGTEDAEIADGGTEDTLATAPAGDSD